MAITAKSGCALKPLAGALGAGRCRRRGACGCARRTARRSKGKRSAHPGRLQRDHLRPTNRSLACGARRVLTAIAPRSYGQRAAAKEAIADYS